MIIEMLKDYLKEWHTKEDILSTILFLTGNSLEERHFRRLKEEYNEKYFNHEVNMCLVHSNSKGYKLTNDPKEIIEMETDFIKRAKDMLYKAYTCKRARLENNNYSFEDFIEEQKSPMFEHQTVV